MKRIVSLIVVLIVVLSISITTVYAASSFSISGTTYGKITGSNSVSYVTSLKSAFLDVRSETPAYSYIIALEAVKTSNGAAVPNGIQSDKNTANFKGNPYLIVMYDLPGVTYTTTHYGSHEVHGTGNTVWHRYTTAQG